MSLPAPRRMLVEVTGDPGHFVDLDMVFEFYDNPETKQLQVDLPAPAFICHPLTTDDPDDDGSGPHQVILSGESRELALAYIRAQAAKARDYLRALL
jgi:hypothetical protein